MFCHHQVSTSPAVWCCLCKVETVEIYSANSVLQLFRSAIYIQIQIFTQKIEAVKLGEIGNKLRSDIIQALLCLHWNYLWFSAHIDRNPGDISSAGNPSKSVSVSDWLLTGIQSIGITNSQRHWTQYYTWRVFQTKYSNTKQELHNTTGTKQVGRGFWSFGSERFVCFIFG